MTHESLEAEVLLLPKQSQATLLARMLERLGQGNEIDQEVSSGWIEEAELRDRVMKLLEFLPNKYCSKFVHP